MKSRKYLFTALAVIALILAVSMISCNKGDSDTTDTTSVTEMSTSAPTTETKKKETSGEYQGDHIFDNETAESLNIEIGEPEPTDPYTKNY